MDGVDPQQIDDRIADAAHHDAIVFLRVLNTLPIIWRKPHDLRALAG